MVDGKHPRSAGHRLVIRQKTTPGAATTGVKQESQEAQKGNFTMQTKPQTVKSLSTRIGGQPVRIVLRGQLPQTAVQRLITAAIRCGWTKPMGGVA